MKKFLKWFLIIVVVLIVLGAIGGSGKSKDTNQQSTNTNSDSSNSKSADNQQDAEKTYGLNQPVKEGDLVFTVTNVTTAKTLGSSFSEKNAQGTFHIVTIKIENSGNKTATFDSSMAKIVDNQNREFERSIEGQTAKGMAQGNVDLFLQQIQPSLSVTGDIVFDLPDNVSNPTLLVKGSLFGTGAKIKLQ